MQRRLRLMTRRGRTPESHPALLTVGGDAVLRFWVEVTLRPLLGSDGCG